MFDTIKRVAPFLWRLITWPFRRRVAALPPAGSFNGIDRAIDPIRLYEAPAEKGTRFLPVHDSVVFRLEKIGVSEGGLVLPDNAKGKDITLGVVEAVGPGRLLPSGHRSEVPVKVGDRFILSTLDRVTEFWGSRDKKIYIVCADDIAAVVEGYEEPQVIRPAGGLWPVA